MTPQQAEEALRGAVKSCIETGVKVGRALDIVDEEVRLYLKARTAETFPKN